jgi:hypothetical protein
MTAATAPDGLLRYLPYLDAFCRSAIALVFGLSFLGKVSNITLFEQTIARFDILPERSGLIAARLFLAGELAVVCLVTIGDTLQISLRALGYALAICMLALFSIAILSALDRRIYTSCNCFGYSEKPLSLYDVVRNAGFAIIALVGWASASFIGGGREGPHLAGWGLAIGSAAIFVAIWTNIQEITQLFRGG